MKRAWKAIGFLAALTAMYRNAGAVDLPSFSVHIGHVTGHFLTGLCGLIRVGAIVVAYFADSPIVERWQERSTEHRHRTIVARAERARRRQARRAERRW